MRISIKVICSFILLFNSCSSSVSQNLLEAPYECLPFAISLNTYPIHLRDYRGGVRVLYKLNNNGEMTNCIITSLNVINKKERISFFVPTNIIFEEDIIYPNSIVHLVKELKVMVERPCIKRTSCINNQQEYIIPMYFKICQE